MKETKVPGKSRVQRRPRVPGGKALARLRLFEQQRADQLGETPTAVAARVTQRPSPARDAKPAAQNKSAARPSPFLAAAKAQAAAAPAAAAAAVGQCWRPIGPMSVPHGQTYGKGAGSRPSVSGRVSSVAVDPGDPKHILIGSGGGGVWESRDDGNSWSPRTDDQPSLSIGAIAFDPTNPSIAYAGTGEGDDAMSDGTHMLGAGLLKSTDGGTKWSLLTGAPLDRLGFFDMVVDPEDGQHLLVGTSRGLFRSADGGTTWSQRRTAFTWKISIGTVIAANGTRTRELLAACDDGLFRSTNGVTWATTPVSLPGGSAGYTRLEVCHAPSDPNVVYVFGARDVAVPEGSTPAQQTALVGRIWRRAVLGGPFKAVPLPPGLEVDQAWYDWFAGVAPNNPNVLYVAGIQVHKGIRSTSDQWKWETISAKEPTGDSIHPDQHAIAFSPADPNVLYVGNDGGIYRSPNAGKTWKSLNRGLGITQIEFLTQHPKFEAWLLAGTQDNGTMRYQGDSVWFHVGDGDGGDCGVNAASPYTCFHTYYGMGLARSTRGGGWNTFPDVGPAVTKADDYPGNALFYPPVEVHGRVVAQAGKRVFLSNDDGTHWSSIVALPLGKRELASALAMPSPTRVYCGTNAGRLFRTDFVSGAWQPAVPLTTPDAGFISDLLVDPTNATVLYATFTSSQSGGRVFRSPDGGTTWSRADAGLPPELPVNAIEIDPKNPGTLFCAADKGVYVTRNAGGAWVLLNAALPNALVKDLAFHPEARLLRAGTQSRGVWEIAVDAATIPAVEIYLRDSSVDTGRLSPSPSGVDDPFVFGAQTFWWQCKDIKVDSPSFRRPAIADVDFEAFSDDHPMIDGGINFAAGLTNENPQRDQTVRVFVQVHNRGVDAAKNVSVKVFFAASGTAFPDLPAAFWTNFPNNVVGAGSAWQPIAPHHPLAEIGPGRSEIAGFEWRVPSDAANQVALLAIITADNDPLVTTELNVATLVQKEKRCGLRNVAVVNIAPHAGPPVLAVPLDAGPAGVTQMPAMQLDLDQGIRKLLRAVVLGKRLVAAARKAGWKAVRLTAADREELDRLIVRDPRLKKTLEQKTGFIPPGAARTQSLDLPKGPPQPLVLLLRSNPSPGYGSVVLTAADGTVTGGLTLQAGERDR
jgi:photosystem II stability/assembly factor-like uncharacterized protein